MRESPYDVIVVGAGIAGLTAALAAAAEGRVALVSKSPVLATSSWLAQGGVAAATGPGDSPALHDEDTLRAGRRLCRPSAVTVLTEEAPARIVDLVDAGVEFDEGLGLEGGHSCRRILHAEGASTGERIARVLAERALAHPRVDALEGQRITALWTDGERCVGVATAEGRLAAPATVLATGGMAALWERTTNPLGSTGDGAVLAYRAGAALADLELVQFHPTVLADNGLLLSALWDAAFDKGLVTFEDDGTPRYAPALGAEACAALGWTVPIALSAQHRLRMAWHREKIFARTEGELY